MSEFLAEASVLIRPDTTKFRATLQAELIAATKGVTVPVPVAAVAPTGVQAAAKQAAASTQVATVASRERATALQLEGAAAQKAAAQTAQLAQAEQLAAKAAAQVAAVEKAGALVTSELARTKAVLRAASAAAAQAETAFAAALRTSNPALIESVRSTRALAIAQAQAAEAAALQAAAQAKAAPAVARQAAAQEQLARGAGATGLAMLGARGATLAAGNQFLIGAASVTLLAKSIQGAAEDAEALAKIMRALGPELGQQLAQSAGRLSIQFGIADDQILSFQATIAQMLRTVDVAPERIAAISETMTKLAADMAAFANVDVTTALTALRSGLAGNVRGLRLFGLTLSSTQVTQEALRETGKKSADQLTQQEIVLARYRLILEQTSNIQGAFADSSGRLTSQSKILRANIDDLSDSIGGLLLPVITELVKTLNFAFEGFQKFKQGISDAKAAAEDFIPGGERTVGILKEIGTTVALGPLFGPLRLVKNAVDDTSDAAERGSTAWRAYGDSLFSVVDALKAAAPAINAMLDSLARQKAITQAGGRAAGLAEALLDIQFAGGSPEAQIANLRAQIAQQEKIIKEGTEGGKRLTEKVRAAKAERNRLQQEILAIQEAQAADAKAAAAEAERLRNEALQAQREFEQAVIDSLSLRQEAAELDILRAEGTKTLQDDIKTHLAFRALLRSQIAIVKAQIKDRLLRARTLLGLRRAIITETLAIRGLIQEQREQRREQAELRREQEKTRREEALEGLRLQVQIAGAEGRTKDEIRRLEKLIRVEERLLRTMKKETNEKKRLRLQIAQDKAELKKLKEAQEDRTKAFRELAFAFLQQQQGFAATLLGNLIPFGAQIGTVGGGQRTSLGLPRPVEAGLAAAAQTTAARERTTTQAQTQTMIEVLRAILRVLQSQKRGQEHPEARYQRASGSAAMDVL